MRQNLFENLKAYYNISILYYIRIFFSFYLQAVLYFSALSELMSFHFLSAVYCLDFDTAVVRRSCCYGCISAQSARFQCQHCVYFHILYSCQCPDSDILIYLFKVTLMIFWYWYLEIIGILKLYYKLFVLCCCSSEFFELCFAMHCFYDISCISHSKK